MIDKQTAILVLSSLLMGMMVSALMILYAENDRKKEFKSARMIECLYGIDQSACVEKIK